MGILDLYRSPKPPRDRQVGDNDDAPVEEPLEPLPRISMSELWPPSPRVRLLYIGVGFFLINMALICIWALVLISNS